MNQMIQMEPDYWKLRTRERYIGLLFLFLYVFFKLYQVFVFLMYQVFRLTDLLQ